MLYLDGTVPFPELLSHLSGRLEEAASFYRGGEIRVDWGGRNVQESERKELERVIAEHGLLMASSDPATASAAATATGAPVARTAPAPTSSGAGRPGVGVSDGRGTDSADGLRTLYIRRTLRSGQRLRFDGHVVLFGDVHPGAEVIATGDVIILGRLRGMVHAGAGGDRKAVVVALQFAPMQLRIAQLISRAPDDAPPARGPEQAEIRGEQIVVRPLLNY